MRQRQRAADEVSVHLRPLTQAERAHDRARTLAQGQAGHAEIDALIGCVTIAPTEVELGVTRVVPFVEQMEGGKVRTARAPQVAPATAVFWATEHVVNARIERGLPG